MKAAFKEWAVVVDALEQGEQCLILRKGGLVEGRGGFQVDQTRFLLFPTQFHQQRAQVLPPAQRRFDELEPTFPATDEILIQGWAEVVAWRKLASLAAAERLRGFHIWRDEVIADRFDWGRELAIHVLILRVYRLSRPWKGPLLPAYGGCKSWIEIAEEVDTEGSQPVLDDGAFTAGFGRLAALLDL